MKLFKLLFFATVILASKLVAQERYPTHYVFYTSSVFYPYGSDEIKNLTSNTLYVVTTGDKMFDDTLKAAVTKYWTVTPTKFVGPEEVDGLLSDEKNTFLATTSGFFSSSTSKTDCAIGSPLKNKLHTTNNKDQISELTLFHGGKHKGLDIRYQMPIGRSEFVFDPTKPGVMDSNDINGMSYVVKALNDELNIIITKKIEKVTNLNTSSGYVLSVVKDEINKNAKVLKNKTLLVDKLWTTYLLKEKTMKAYKYQYQFVSSAEMISLLKTDPSKYCFIGQDLSGSIEIYDGATKSLVYSQWKEIAIAGVKEDQIKELNSAIDKY